MPSESQQHEFSQDDNAEFSRLAQKMRGVGFWFEVYGIIMLSLFAFRKKEPTASRPFKVPFFPLTPLLALTIALFSTLAMTYYYWQLALAFVVLMSIAFVLFKIFVRLTAQ